MSNWDMASIRLYALTVVFVLVEWNNAVFYTNIVYYIFVNRNLPVPIPYERQLISGYFATNVIQ
jgi:hypothetical protein